jgi:hypothetical protein
MDTLSFISRCLIHSNNPHHRFWYLCAYWAELINAAWKNMYLFSVVKSCDAESMFVRYWASSVGSWMHMSLLYIYFFELIFMLYRENNYNIEWYKFLYQFDDILTLTVAVIAFELNSRVMRLEWKLLLALYNLKYPWFLWRCEDILRNTGINFV